MMGSKAVHIFYAVHLADARYVPRFATFSPKLKSSRGVAHACSHDMRRVGSPLVSQCITKAHLPMQDIASNICGTVIKGHRNLQETPFHYRSGLTICYQRVTGSDAQLDLILGEFAPKARCREPGRMATDPRLYCQAIAEVMIPTLVASGEELAPVFFGIPVALTLECSLQEQMRLTHFHYGGVRLYLLGLR